jgi:hypothetical protein
VWLTRAAPAPAIEFYYADCCQPDEKYVMGLRQQIVLAARQMLACWLETARLQEVGLHHLMSLMKRSDLMIEC